MKAVSPVVPGYKSIEVVIGEGLEGYPPLPTVNVDIKAGRIVVTRWRLSKEERKKVANGGDIVLQLLMGRQSLPTPTHLQIAMPDEMPVLGEE